MARIFFAPEVLEDFDRFFDHVAAADPSDAADRVADIVEAVQVLASSPLIGRPVRDGKGELVVGRAARGYVLLYRFVPVADAVFVLAARNQREAGYKRKV